MISETESMPVIVGEVAILQIVQIKNKSRPETDIPPTLYLQT
jgi:hypothetical protein